MMPVVVMPGMVVLPLMMARHVVMMPLVMPVVMVPVMMAMGHRRLFLHRHRLQLLRFLGCRFSD